LSRSAVLVITNERDVGADFLVRELDRRSVRVVRLNAERGPDWTLALEPGERWRMSRDRRTLRSDDCTGVWWRRPEVPAIPGSASAAADAIGDQWRSFVAALATVPGPVWVSAPDRIREAENKALQLSRANALGMGVPETLWTNDTDEAADFIGRCGGVAVVKSVATAWWEEANTGRFVFASLVERGDLPEARRLAAAPVCLQQPVLPKRDVRVTVVGDTVLAARRELPPVSGSEPLDWRRAPEQAWSTHNLPADVADRCRALVAGFGLGFSGIDFALDDQGEHWLLELNPNGEWGWLQRVGLPVAEALADALLQRMTEA
jgi:glutathione synthase/RimK-type ligase-like ATP-grasp enzyme